MNIAIVACSILFASLFFWAFLHVDHWLARRRLSRTFARAEHALRLCEERRARKSMGLK